MKKLVLLTCGAFCIVFMAASYKTGGSGQQKLKRVTLPDSVIVEKSLNGISQTDANAMIQNAVSTVDTSPANTQIWFSLQTVMSVDSLLKADSSGVIKPDGIRIYFSSSKPTTANPIHYNNGIVVVSTYKSGVIFKNHASIAVHTDYFEHSQSAGLFSLNTIGGTINHDSDTSKGAMLYYSCNCDISSCITSSDHYIARSTGEKMVQAFPGSPFNAKSEWFDIGMLNGLVVEMIKNNDDGIRIYFARGVAGIEGSNDVGKSRFVVVTTQSATDPVTHANIHKDYFGCDHTAMVSVSTAIKKRQGTNDNGELCPSNCDGVTQP